MNQEEQAKKMQKIIAKAWADETFKQRLLSTPSETLREEGLETPPDVEVRVVESTDKVVYLVLPPKPSSEDVSDELIEARGSIHTQQHYPWILVKPVSGWGSSSALPRWWRHRPSELRSGSAVGCL